MPALRQLTFRGYRSLHDLRLHLGQLTVITGGNGVGKSNVYRALSLAQKLAQGTFAKAVAREGGMPSMVWAGERKKNENIRIHLGIHHQDFNYTLEAGLIPTMPLDPTRFRTDPDLKIETLATSGPSGKVMAQRKAASIFLRGSSGKLEPIPLPFHAPESMLSEVRAGLLHPFRTATRETLLQWRFHHHFPTDPASPLRKPMIGFWSPVLAENGENVAATLQTLRESHRLQPLDDVFSEAFPETSWSPVNDDGSFEIRLLRHDLKRWLSSAELSDGTLRFFCLAAALLTSHPPPLLVLNEPETSLHPKLFPAISQLIAHAAKDTQIIIVSHSEELTSEIEKHSKITRLDLAIDRGRTRLSSHLGSNRVWEFGGEE